MLAFPKPTKRMRVQKPLKRATYLGARRAAAKASGTLTAEEWQRICAWARWSCAWEGKHAGNVQQGHIKAIARGGTHCASNVAPICEGHNQAHGTRTVEPKPGHPYRQGAR